MPVYFDNNGEPDQGKRPLDACPGERLHSDAQAERRAMDGGWVD